MTESSQMSERLEKLGLSFSEFRELRQDINQYIHYYWPNLGPILHLPEENPLVKGLLADCQLREWQASQQQSAAGRAKQEFLKKLSEQSLSTNEQGETELRLNRFASRADLFDLALESLKQNNLLKNQDTQLDLLKSPEPSLL